MIAALGASSRLSTVANAAAAGAFAAYVGVGLAGVGDLGSYNLALDNDGFGGGAVVGCPAYEEVRQPTMDGFDLNKYEGLWYEQAYHDYTQFSEVETRGVVVASSSRLRLGDAAEGSRRLVSASATRRGGRTRRGGGGGEFVSMSATRRLVRAREEGWGLPALGGEGPRRAPPTAIGTCPLWIRRVTHRETRGDCALVSSSM